MGRSARSSCARPGRMADKERAFARFDRTDPRQRAGTCGRTDSLPPASARSPSEASPLAEFGSGAAWRVDGQLKAELAFSIEPTSSTAAAPRRRNGIQYRRKVFNTVWSRGRLQLCIDLSHNGTHESFSFCARAPQAKVFLRFRRCDGRTFLRFPWSAARGAACARTGTRDDRHSVGS